ncbi:MAG: SDR family oxidoreductase [Candidatus Bipolaricaulota bacterium]
MTFSKQALITGATQGIGQAIATRLARDGFSVVLNYRTNETKAAETLKTICKLSPDSILVKGDVTTEDGVNHIISEAATRGPINLLVNNVGDFLFKPALDTTIEEWNHILESNLTSAFLCCKAIIPHMREHQGGQIINIGVMNSEVLRAVPNTVPYTIAKTGLLILTKSLAKTEARWKIRINAVNPGHITSEHPPTGSRNTIPLGRMGKPEEIASVVSFLASAEADYITGAIVNVHGGAYL